MCPDSKCTNRKWINFHETERSWKQTSRRRIEKLTWNKNGCVTLILTMKCLRMFHPWETSMMLSCFVWFLSDVTCWCFETWKKNFVWIFDDVFTVRGSSEMYCSCWDGERIRFSKNYVVTFTVGCINDNWKLCKNRNTDRHQERNLFCEKVSKSIILQFLLINNRRNDN